MAHPIVVKEQAIALRTSGHSLGEIALHCNISHATASVWVRGVKLDAAAELRLLARKALGRKRSVEYFERKALGDSQEIQEEIDALLADTALANQLKILVALWWCEGVKNLRGGIKFTNADPNTIKYFLYLLKSVFPIRKERLRAMLHLHDYHDVQEQIEFWSNKIGLSQSKFYKPYIKPHTAKRKKLDYPGCITVIYPDARLARLLKATWDIISIGKPGV